MLVFLASIFPITDNDVWWHLKNGEYTCLNKAILRQDIFSYTITGKELISHEWLSDVVFYQVRSLFGIRGITVFKALLALFIFIVMYRGVKNKQELIVWLIFAAAFYAMRDGLRERPQMFSYLLTAVYIYALRQKNTKTLCYIPLLQVLWANLHGAACFMGLGIIILFSLFETNIKPVNRIYLVLTVLAASFANPFGYKIFVYVYNSFNQGFTGLVTEFRHPVLSIQFGFYFLLLGLSVVSLLLNKKRVGWEEAVMFFAAAGSLTAIRNIPVFAVIAAPIAAENLSEVYSKYSERFPLDMDYLRAGILGLLLTLLFWTAGDKLDVTGRFKFGTGIAHRCKYAAEFIKYCSLRGFKGPMFNDYDFGGYIIWRLYPLQKVFVDGRMVEYGKDFVEKTFYFWKPEIWQELENKYNFTGAVVPNERYYSCSYLDSRKDWVLVYWDDYALVYFKNIPQNKEFISKYGYRFLRPNSPNQEYLKQEPVGNVLCEIERSLYFSPGSCKAKWMKNFVCSQ